ncbi:dehydratase [Clostridiales bacterium PH28_bin88]|nr:dehydratase [Clostridiales bacterium PH28_bin88]
MYYEDCTVGESHITPARTITEADVVMFAGLSGDYNPLHIDAEFGKGTIFKERIAHGLLGLAVAAGLKARLGLFDGTVVAFLGLTWEFKKPIFFGDTIHACFTIAEKRETKQPDRGIIVQDVQVFNQRGEVVQAGRHTVMVKRRPQD